MERPSVVGVEKTKAVVVRTRRDIVLGLMVGVSFLSMSFLFLRDLPRYWQTGASFFLLIAVVIGLWLGLAGVVIILSPLQDTRPFDVILRYSRRLLVLVPMGYSFIAAPIAVFSFVVMVPAFVWITLQRLGIIPPIPEQAFNYVSLVLAVLVFTYKGDRLTASFLKWVGWEFDSSKLIKMLQPRLIVLYVYGILAVAYFIANFEKFSGIIIVPFQFWVGYKDVLLEVLLTYVAVDQVRVLLKAYWDTHKG